MTRTAAGPLTASTTTRHTYARRAVGHALVDVCRGRVPSLPAGPVERADFVAAARYHRIAPLAHVLLREAQPELAGPLREDRDTAKDVHLRAAFVLASLDQVLGDVPWATFKGPVLSELAHPVPGLRMYKDVDVIVAPTALRAVTGRLLAAGWEVGDYTDILDNPDLPGEMHWRSPAGLWVDLHWSMINMAVRRGRFRVPTDQLLGRRRTTTVGMSRVPVLDEVDAFIHVCLHATLTGAHRLLLLLDVDQLVRAVTDWDLVVARAREWRAQAPLAVALVRARSVLGTPAPLDLGDRLGISGDVQQLLAATDRLFPVPRLRREASAARFVARAVREDTPRTLARLSRNAAHGFRDRLARPAPRAERQQAGQRSLDSFLARVEAEAEERR